MDENIQAMYSQYMSDIQSMQHANNAWNAQQAAAARQYERTMSNSAHQREVQDLIKAGLNPVLSAGGSGATTTSGNAAQSGDANISALAGLMSKMLDASLAQSRASAASAQAIATQAETDLEKSKIDGSSTSVDGYFAPLGTAKGPSKGVVDLSKQFVDPIVQRNEQEYIRDAITAINKDFGNVFMRKSAKRGTVNKPRRVYSTNFYSSALNRARDAMTSEEAEALLSRVISLGRQNSLNRTIVHNVPALEAAFMILSQWLANGYNRVTDHLSFADRMARLGIDLANRSN